MDYLSDFADSHKMQIVEDCAHSLSVIEGKIHVGHGYGPAFASPPKFIASLPIGIVETDDLELQGYIVDQQKKTRSASVAKNMYRKYRLDVSLRNNENRSSTNIQRLVESASSLYSSYPFVHRSSKGQVNGLIMLIEEFDVRKKRVMEIYRAFDSGLLPTKIADSVTHAPFKVPVFLNQEQRLNVIRISTENKLTLHEVHFDRNQNMLRPDYVQCICIPIQSQISDTDFGRIIEIIQSVI
jgi:dTDP-4-amino-4,6-dideoxygalactose transaminase